MAQTADRLGFDSIWCAEHHFSTYGYLSRPLMFAIHLAAQTERIRVGSAVVVLPLHHPLIVAEEIATADILSGGRLDVGLGRGYQPYEFERLGQTLDREPRALRRVRRHSAEGVRGGPILPRGQVLQLRRDQCVPDVHPTAAPADLDGRDRAPSRSSRRLSEASI